MICQQCAYTNGIYSRNFRCSVKETVILLLLWSTLYWFWLATIHPKCMYKSCSFLKFDVLHGGSIFIAFFVEHPVCSNFEMYSVLVLVFFYFSWLPLIHSASAKVDFSWNFRCSVKEAVLLLHSWRVLYIAFSKYKVSWFYFSYFNLPLLTETVYEKVTYSWNLRYSTKEAVLLLLSWSTLYVAISKCIVSWF